jgi:energy-converting hydrogenase Eha subunit G
MKNIWVASLMLGLALYVTTRRSSAYEFRLIARLTGLVLIIAGLIGVIYYPANWLLALLVLGCVAGGVVAMVAYVLLMKLTRRY